MNETNELNKDGQQEVTATDKQSDSDADWGFSIIKRSVSREAKMGLSAILVLLIAFGFVLYPRIASYYRSLTGTSSEHESEHQADLAEGGRTPGNQRQPGQSPDPFAFPAESEADPQSDSVGPQSSPLSAPAALAGWQDATLAESEPVPGQTEPTFDDQNEPSPDQPNRFVAEGSPDPVNVSTASIPLLPDNAQTGSSESVASSFPTLEGQSEPEAATGAAPTMASGPTFEVPASASASFEPVAVEPAAIEPAGFDQLPTETTEPSALAARKSNSVARRSQDPKSLDAQESPSQKNRSKGKKKVPNSEKSNRQTHSGADSGERDGSQRSQRNQAPADPFAPVETNGTSDTVDPFEPPISRSAHHSGTSATSEPQFSTNGAHPSGSVAKDGSLTPRQPVDSRLDGFVPVPHQQASGQTTREDGLEPNNRAGEPVQASKERRLNRTVVESSTSPVPGADAGRPRVANSPQRVGDTLVPIRSNTLPVVRGEQDGGPKQQLGGPVSRPTGTLNATRERGPFRVSSGKERVASKGARQVYVIQQNDSFWTISKRVYGTARYFQALALHNKSRIPDPKRMRPGTSIETPTPAELKARYPALLGPSRSRSATVRVSESGPDSSSTSTSASPTSGFFLNSQGEPLFRVGPDDTLTGIAQQHLGRSSRWIQIFQLNRDRLQNPNNLKIGSILRLPADASRIRLVETPRTAR